MWWYLHPHLIPVRVERQERLSIHNKSSRRDYFISIQTIDMDGLGRDDNDDDDWESHLTQTTNFWYENEKCSETERKARYCYRGKSPGDYSEDFNPRDCPYRRLSYHHLSLRPHGLGNADLHPPPPYSIYLATASPILAIPAPPLASLLDIF
jgi:hypothetical protein